MKTLSFIHCLLLILPSVLSAQDRFVTGGRTSILFDSDILSLADLTISSFSAEVIIPGDLGESSVALPINSRSGNLATTFAYTIGSLNPFSGTIEHSGSIFFNNDSEQIGDLTIGFDELRASGNASGFFVESNAGLTEILFDVQIPDSVVPDSNQLTIQANLLISPELAAVLGNPAFSGVVGGQVLVSATAIPEPTVMLLLAGYCGFLLVRRRRLPPHMVG